MLDRAHRVVSGADYKRIVRRGRRVTAPATTAYLVRRQADEVTRVGVIVAKNVGNAVTRNLVRRRIKAASRAALVERPTGADIVFRAQPGAALVPFSVLDAEVRTAFRSAAR